MALTRFEFRALVALNRHKLGRRLTRHAPPDAQARLYVRALKGLPAALWAATEKHLIPVLKKLSTDSLTTDAGLDKVAIKQAIAAAEAEVNRTWSTSRIASMVEPVAGGVEKFQAQSLNNQLRPVVGVDAVGGETWLKPKVSEFVTRNVALIKTIDSRFFTEIAALVTEESNKGERWEDLAKRLQERTGVAESRAKLIARDQVSKFYSELNTARQSSLGIKKATWRTANDNRVRDEHEALNGELYDLANPPDGGPGHAVGCRCYGDPDLESALETGVESEMRAPEPEEENDPELTEVEPEPTVEVMPTPEDELRAKFERENLENMEKIRAQAQFRKDPSGLTEEQIKRLSPERQDLARDVINKAKLAREARDQAKANLTKVERNPEGAQENPDIKTYPLLAGVYLNQRMIERGETLTHAYRAGEATTLCRRIKAEKLADSMTATDDPPQCSACLGRDPRFK